MDEIKSNHHLPVLTTDSDGRSAWAIARWPIEERGGMLLSPRIGCNSLRLRESRPGYVTDWHLAGEAVLIIVQSGTLRISLHDQTTRDFIAGEAFIAADTLPEDIAFDPDQHGHKAEVVGNQTLRAIHIKLDDFQR